MLSFGIAGVVEALFVSPYTGEPMLAMQAVQAMPGRGLHGDRYLTGTGHWSGVDECQVTLVEAEILERIVQEARLMLQGGEHRRNIVTRGVRLHQLLGKRFTIGQALFEYDRPRPPCPHIEELTGVGVAKALSGQRGGIGARILRGGLIQVGDSVTVVPGDEPMLAGGQGG